MRFILLNIVLLLSVGLFAQKENKYIRSGNDLYAEENYKDAEVDYMKALEANPGSNKGNLILEMRFINRRAMKMLQKFSIIRLNC